MQRTAILVTEKFTHNIYCLLSILFYRTCLHGHVVASWWGNKRPDMDRRRQENATVFFYVVPSVSLRRVYALCEYYWNRVLVTNLEGLLFSHAASESVRRCSSRILQQILFTVRFNHRRFISFHATECSQWRGKPCVWLWSRRWTAVLNHEDEHAWHYLSKIVLICCKDYKQKKSKNMASHLPLQFCAKWKQNEIWNVFDKAHNCQWSVFPFGDAMPLNLGFLLSR